MKQKSSYRIPLEELLTLIKASGYELNVQQILEIQSALLTTSVSHMGLAGLKFLIAPVIAKNAGDQRHLHQIIDAYIAEKKTIVTPPIRPFTQWLHTHKKQVFALKIAAFLLIVITGVVFYLYTNNKNNTPEAAKPTTLPKQDTVVAKPEAKPASPVKTQASTTIAPAKTNHTITATVTASERYIRPVPIDINLQLSMTFGTIAGIIMAWIVVYEHRKKMDLKEKRRAEDAIFVKRGGTRKFVGPGYESEGTWAQPTVLFPDRDYLIHVPPSIQKIKSFFKKQAAVHNPGLNIQKSIHKSVRNAGFTSLVYSNEWKDRKYLFLVDNTHPQSHRHAYLNHLVNTLCASVTKVARYNFQGTPNQVQDEHGNTISLEKLADKYAGYHLLLFSDGHFLEMPVPFQRWNSRSIITPVPLPDWSLHETLLQKNNFLLVPAETTAVALLAQAIAEDGEITQQQLHKRLQGLYSLKDQEFKNVQDVKQYLNDKKLFQLLCSLAIYPRLQWSLTVALLDAILKNNTSGEPAVELTHDLLLKVARIPWLQEEKLPDNIRLQLLDSLAAETEVIARETILALLDEARTITPANSPAYTEIDTQYAINAFFLFSYDQYKYKKYAGTKAVISDYWSNLSEWSLKEHVNKGGNSLMPKFKENQDAVQEFLLNDKLFEGWNLNFTKAALVTLPAILLYIIFAIFKPAFVYPPESFKNVSFSTIVHKEGNCTQQLLYAINTTNGASDTIYLSPMTAVDTLLIHDVKYNEMVSLELWTKDNLMRTLSFPARDSFVTVGARCE
ncbi:hypothetical protein A4D02_04865 [Niastella koreensis]|uniref:Uncharacterized protein n=2 Tax=Niastella koreensis TaxID=354356 RepID=G8T7Q9_NIAKG|nr:hypothetical protein [Niastella koreensis]AEW03353.1 hypothetical protein Niako_7134 [Niastella koreensis GR20-10]OQP55638.1 hypothetical protein A4D02_04865 [Niastella koreensis]